MQLYNAIHSVTGFTLFEIIKGYIDSGNPFELSDNKIISNSIQSYNEKVKLLYN